MPGLVIGETGSYVGEGRIGQALYDGCPAGPFPASVVTNDTGTGTIAWSGGSFGIQRSTLATSNNQGIDVALTVTQDSNYLKGLDPQLDLDPAVSVTGIAVKVEAKVMTGVGSPTFSVRLVVGGAVVGNTKTFIATTTDVVYTLGGDGDLWGLTPTVAQVNATNFGYVIFITNAIADTYSVDHVTVTAYCAVPADNTTPDKWLPVHPSRIAGRKPNSYSYQAQFEPFALGAPEATALDKWFVQRPERLYGRKPNIYTATWLTLPPSGEPEATQLDKYFVQRPERMHPRKPNAYAYPFLALPPPEEPLDGLKWFVQRPERTYGRKPNAYTYPFHWLDLTIGAPEATALDKWFVQRPEFIFKRPPVRPWMPAYSDPAFPIVAAGEDITIDKWWNQRPERTYGKKPDTYAYPFHWLDLTLGSPEATTLDKWFIQRPERTYGRKPNAYTYPFHWLDLTIGAPETTALDKWWVQRPERLHGRKPNSYTSPWLALPPPEEPLDGLKWFVQRPERLHGRRPDTYAYPWLAQPPIEEPLDGLKWFSQRPEYIARRKGWAYTYPPTERDMTFLSEIVTVDKWLQQRPEYLFRGKRLQFAYPFYWRDPELIALVAAIETWYHQRPEYIARRRAWSWVYPVTGTWTTEGLQNPRGPRPDMVASARAPKRLVPGGAVELER